MRTLTVVLALVTTQAAVGQGQLYFQNSTATLISTNGVHGGSALGPTEVYSGTGDPQFVYALFAAPSTVTSVSGVTDPNWSFLGVYATNTTSASGGRLNGGLVILSPAYAVGSTFSFLVRGWSSSIAGQDWSAAQTFMHNFEADPNASGSAGQLFGASDIAVMQVGGGGLPPQFVFATTPGTSVQGFLLDQVPIPEPSIFALIGLGGATVLIFRRKPRLGPVRKAPAA